MQLSARLFSLQPFIGKRKVKVIKRRGEKK